MCPKGEDILPKGGDAILEDCLPKLAPNQTQIIQEGKQDSNRKAGRIPEKNRKADPKDLSRRS